MDYKARASNCDLKVHLKILKILEKANIIYHVLVFFKKLILHDKSSVNIPSRVQIKQDIESEDCINNIMVNTHSNRNKLIMNKKKNLKVSRWIAITSEQHIK